MINANLGKGDRPPDKNRMATKTERDESENDEGESTGEDLLLRELPLDSSEDSDPVSASKLTSPKMIHQSSDSSRAWASRREMSLRVTAM